jgi:Tol biopolymer transport system component
MPFHESGPGIVDAILNQPAQPPSSQNQDLPPGVDSIVLKALEKSPDRRYQSAREIAGDLERLSVGIMPRPAVASRTRLRLALGMLAAAALVIGGLWLGTRRNGGPAHVEFIQLTHFTDAAGVPAISPDGRMLAYLRGQITFGTSGQRNSQIWVQLLPNGQPTQLTNNEPSKNWPAFSPDGSRLAYTIQSPGFGWDTWEVPPLGGEPRQLMPNASGLTWLGDRLLYSKVVSNQGIHMAIATSSPSRTDERTIYAPPGASSMAHRSFLSPDGKLLLVVEMDSAGTWLPCRVIPFDGSTAGTPVGPPNAQCTAAAWSPDGRWMYFSSNVGGAFHLWRQRFPNGQPEQLTFGPTEEEGIAMAADGKSLLTAAGTRNSTVWIHDPSGDRQITSEGFSLQPSLSPDRKTVYYVVQSATTPHSYVSGELWRADLSTGRTEPALPGVIISHYSISPDSRRVLYTTDTPAPGGLWIADLDHRTSPRQLTHGGESRGFFGAPGEIIYQENNSLPTRLMRMAEDGSNVRQVVPNPILLLLSVSSDGRWASANIPAPDAGGTKIVAFDLKTGKTTIVCRSCSLGIGPARIWLPPVQWSRDSRFMYIATRAFERTERTAVIPLHGAPIALDADQALTVEALRKKFGARVINERDVYPGSDPANYVFTRYTAQTNIYRVVLPQD